MGGLISGLIILIDGSPYRVLNLEDGIRDGFRIDCAYHVVTALDDRVYPYQGKLKNLRKLKPDMAPGIYESAETGKWTILYPKKNRWKMYEVDSIRSFNDAALFKDVSFINTDIDLQADGDIFMPPIRPDDDMLNKIVKHCIRLKEIVFDSYKNRFDTMGSSGKAGKSNTNNKNNAKRALIENRSLSSNKAKEYGDVLEYQIAIVIMDKPNAVNKMRTDGKPIVIFSDDAFDITGAIDISSIDFTEGLSASTIDDHDAYGGDDLFESAKKKKGGRESSSDEDANSPPWE